MPVTIQSSMGIWLRVVTRDAAPLLTQLGAAAERGSEIAESRDGRPGSGRQRAQFRPSLKPRYLPRTTITQMSYSA